MHRIGLVTNHRLKKSLELTVQLADWLQKRGYEVCSVAGQLGDAPELFLPAADLAQAKPDMVIALGGDGTLLSAARVTAPHGVPILGVNMGNLGFLTEVETGNLYGDLERVLKGDFTVDQRMMLQAEVLREGRVIRETGGLNDVVVHKGSLSRILEINFWVEKDFAGSYKGDGIIIASPTGSTAYSLSAGGPVVHPSLEVMVQTWICPHTTTARPSIIPADKHCVIELQAASSEVLLTVDGQTSQPLLKKDQVLVKAAPYKATFIRLTPLNFFSLLKTKLGSETVVRYE
jgi:NAD+ kinase